MRWHTALLGLFVGTATASCAFLLDFEELQKEQGAGTGGAAGDASLDTGDAVAEIPIEQAAKKFAEALCARFDECMPGAASLFYGDVSCVEYTTYRFSDGVLAGLNDLPKDTAEYHPELAQACVEALRSQGVDAGVVECAAALDWPAACEAAVEGKVDKDGACVHPAQCKPGLFCDLKSKCPGKCVSKLGENSPCFDGSCKAGLTCQEFEGQGSFCKTPVAKPGAPCGGPVLARCAVGMLCVGIGFDADAGADAGASPGKCKAASNVFASADQCDWGVGDLCQPGLHCKLEAADLKGKCVEPAPAGGSLCGLAIPDMCPAGEYCKPNFFNPPNVSLAGSCTLLPDVDQPCADDALYNDKCAAGTRCVAGFCKALLPLGVNCGSPEVCYSGFCDATCKAPIFCGP
ncbi:MAG: hypothetical protein IPI67_07570 [Myxococcales bacterium]|nr:hypothetical protein [Myxococcales bacterium]